MAVVRFVCSIATLLVLMAATLAAQTDWNTVKALMVGTEVRINAASRTIRGTVDRITDDSLILNSGTNQQMFDRQQITSVSQRKAGHRLRNTLIGLAAGTGAGLGIGIAARSTPSPLQLVPKPTVVAAFALAGALVGTVLGAVIPTGSWREVYKHQLP